MELVTDQGTQFVNETLTEYLNVAGVLNRNNTIFKRKKTVLLKGKIKKLIDILKTGWTVFLLTV